MVSLSSGFVLRHPLMSSLASWETFVHSGFGNSYCPGEDYYDDVIKLYIL